MKKLDTTRSTWMVGDDLQRIIAGAQKMGIYSIWCDYGRNDLPAGSKVKPDKIINNIADCYRYNRQPDNVGCKNNYVCV